MAKLVGWREWVGLPDLGVERVKVKVDTGAQTSALHAFDITATQIDGVEWVSFSLHPLQSNDALLVQCKAPVHAHRMVRNSGGQEETRVVIETSVHLGEEAWPIEVTLTDRKSMGYRMLLGRNAIAKRFYVDPTKSFLLTKGEVTDREYEEE